MSRFKDMAKDKNTFLSMITGNEDIMRALVYNERNFLEKEPVANSEDYIYEQVMPYRFIPETLGEKKTFITMTFDNFKPVNNVFKTGMVIFEVFTHQELFRTDHGVLRVDYIINKIDELFNDVRVAGIGKLEYAKMGNLAVNEKYHGSYIAYKMYEKN